MPCSYKLFCEKIARRGCYWIMMQSVDWKHSSGHALVSCQILNIMTLTHLHDRRQPSEALTCYGSNKTSQPVSTVRLILHIIGAKKIWIEEEFISGRPMQFSTRNVYWSLLQSNFFMLHNLPEISQRGLFFPPLKHVKLVLMSVFEPRSKWMPRICN